MEEKWHAEIDKENHALYTIIDAAGDAWHKSMKAYLLYMAIRLSEMRRMLKPTGSIYLHCDPTASHYLKMTMDAIFGKENFRNEIVWCYTGGTDRAKGFGKKHDVILFYSKTGKFKFNHVFVPFAESTIKRFNKVDENGRRYKINKLADGRITKTYMKSEGKLAPDYVHINILVKSHKESTGYPTQKPLALLERIIKASSNPGDLVLDPFCGCATACIAAERNGRNWIGIDISSKAIELVKSRMESELQLFYDVDHRIDIMEPASIETRTDEEIQTPYNSEENKQKLFYKQDARCNSCGQKPGIKMMAVDHIKPRSQGGSDDISNLQLLCHPCNENKYTKSDQQFRAWKAKEATNQLAASFTKDANKQDELRKMFEEIIKCGGK